MQTQAEFEPYGRDYSSGVEYYRLFRTALVLVAAFGDSTE